MKPIFFTKFLTGKSAKEVGETARQLGFAGLDLAVRKKQCVTPENAAAALPEAMKIWSDLGLTVPLVTMETQQTKPGDPVTGRLFEACGKAGIRDVKIGYWKWTAAQPYWPTVETIRGDLKQFEKLGRETGVRTLIHTHSGGNYGLNASAALTLVRGFDPKFVGIYLDPAHLAVCGEPPDMTLAIVSDYLALVSVKNCRYQSTKTGGRVAWKADWCQLEEGLVDWPKEIGLLKGAKYDGPLSVHGEYSGPEDLAAILEKVAKDMAFLKKLL